MARKLPPGLSDNDRDALTQFFAGHLSAGQFAERLAGAGPAAESPPVVVEDATADQVNASTVETPAI
jgi:hypothetical protein